VQILVFLGFLKRKTFKIKIFDSPSQQKIAAFQSNGQFRASNSTQLAVELSWVVS